MRVGISVPCFVPKSPNKVNFTKIKNKLCENPNMDEFFMFARMGWVRLMSSISEYKGNTVRNDM